MVIGGVSVDEVRSVLPDWAQNLMMVGYRGSESHGTSLFEGDMATDDVDVFAISIQPTSWYLGLGGYTNASRQAKDTNGERLDIQVYDVRKFFHLLAKGNPNVHAYLWLRPEHYLYNTVPGGWTIMARTAFLSKSCLDALCGYATAQFEKMGKGQLYAGYMGAKRKLQVDRFGYDVKNAAHCLRLLYMGIELCTAGTLYAYRPDEERKVLMEVKSGEWPLDDVKAQAAALWARYRVVEVHADLPERPDYARINQLLVDVIAAANSPATLSEAQGAE